MTSGTLTGAGLSLSTAAVWGGGDFAGGIAAKRANVFRVVAGAHACGLLLMLLLELLCPRRVRLFLGQLLMFNLLLPLNLLSLLLLRRVQLLLLLEVLTLER